MSWPKRDKMIPLSTLLSLIRTDRKGLAFKRKTVEKVRNCITKYKSIYILTFRIMRKELMEGVREQWKHSRFFFGKNKLIVEAFGRNEKEEYAPDLHKLSKCLKGQCALLFTDCDKKEVVEWFESYSCEDFARSGSRVDQTITVPEGPLKELPDSIEPHLRELGMPTKLDSGVVTLVKDYEVCKEDSILTPEQAKILELLGHKLATFKLELRACWVKGEGFERLDVNNGEDDDNEDEEMKEES